MVMEVSSFGKGFMTIGFRTSVADNISLAVETDDEHGTSVHVAAGLVRGEDGRLVALGEDVADAFAEAASAEFVGAAEIVDGIVGVERSDAGLHGAEMFVAEREKV